MSAKSKSTIQFSISLRPEVLEYMDKISAHYGMSRSGFITHMLTVLDSVMGNEDVMKLVKKTMETAVKGALKVK